MIRRRGLLLGLLALPLPAFAGRFLRGTRSGGGGGGDAPLSNNALPGGATSFTATWESDANADSYVVYVSTSSQLYADSSLYTYYYLASGQATESLLISGVASGTYYVRVAAVDNGYLTDLSMEVSYTSA